MTGESWVDIEAILEHRVSDTNLRARRDDWIAAGVFDTLKQEAVTAFDRTKLDPVAVLRRSGDEEVSSKRLDCRSLANRFRGSPALP